jgi:hypothetical protein
MRPGYQEQILYILNKHHSIVTVELGDAVTDDILQLIDSAKREGITGDTSDGYHTFNELYDYRRVYNAKLFNEWALREKYDVHKSWKHSDGNDCFGGGWFVVVAELPTGQITNHYEAKYWDDFAIPEKPTANKYDGHTPQEVLDRIAQLEQSED